MVCSLLSIFDPCSFILIFKLPLKWVTLMFCFFIFNWQFWTNHSGLMIIYKEIVVFIHNLIKQDFISWKSSMLMLVTVFMIVLFGNEMGMIPYLFTYTSHMMFNLSLALPLWMSGFMFSFLNSSKHAFAHFVPLGCPSLLIPLLVLIECISTFMRPLSLSIRLMSNIMAGHMIMALCGDSVWLNVVMTVIIIPMQSGLILFEMMICAIQAYVFTSLLFLYWQENE